MPHFGDKTTWLLPPISLMQESVEIDKACRVNTHVLFMLLEQAVFHVESPGLKDYSDELKRDCIKVLAALQALDEDGHPGVMIDEYRNNWLNGSVDWFHASFLSIPAYREVIEIVRTGDWDSFQGHHGCYLTLARRLGQVARIDHNKGLMLGNAPVSKQSLIDVLNTLLPSLLNEVSIYNLCRAACPALRVTPARLEEALLNLRATWANFPREEPGRRRREPGITETVVRLKLDGYVFEEVHSGKFNMSLLDGLGTIALTQVC